MNRAWCLLFPDQGVPSTNLFYEITINLILAYCATLRDFFAFCRVKTGIYRKLVWVKERRMLWEWQGLSEPPSADLQSVKTARQKSWAADSWRGDGPWETSSLDQVTQYTNVISRSMTIPWVIDFKKSVGRITVNYPRENNSSRLDKFL